jgi:hypothetical protein
MKKIYGRLICVLVPGVFALLLSGEGRDVRLLIRVFVIPQAQQFESVLTDAKGNATDLQVYGSVTSAFPRATVSFPTELAASASDSAIGAAIRERVVFGSGGLVARRVSVRELKSFELLLGGDNPEAESRFEENRGEGRSSDYRVKAELLSAGKGGALIRLRFDAGWNAVGGRLGVGMSDTVISAPVELPESKLFLIGAQSDGAVYWLAVCALQGS